MIPGEKESIELFSRLPLNKRNELIKELTDEIPELKKMEMVGNYKRIWM